MAAEYSRTAPPHAPDIDGKEGSSEALFSPTRRQRRTLSLSGEPRLHMASTVALARRNARCCHKHPRQSRPLIATCPLHCCTHTPPPLQQLHHLHHGCRICSCHWVRTCDSSYHAPQQSRGMRPPATMSHTVKTNLLFVANAHFFLVAPATSALSLLLPFSRPTTRSSSSTTFTTRPRRF